MTAPAQQGQVNLAPGDVNRVCPACNSGQPHGNDGDPRHLALGGGDLTTFMATLPTGQPVPVQMRGDEAFHFDCHAAMGCDHCKDMLAHHDGSVKGKVASGERLDAPDHLLDIEPYEFDEMPHGVLRRARTKKQAAAMREKEMREAGYEFISHDEARELHARHSAEKAAAEQEG